ncbi:Tc3 transposase [Popillia japonica]|uniref:Tc3 transposase n=1 Tax=Popillia japonica TaxID=7064 RepID=A0AAW1I8P1_POPJA
MARGKILNEYEKGQINALNNEGFSNRGIARKINRSEHVVRNFLKNKENYGKKKRSGRPHALSSRDKRRILRVASNSSLTAREIGSAAGVNTNVRNIQRLLKKSPVIKRRKW